MSRTDENAPAPNAGARRPGGRTAENSKRIHAATMTLLVEGGFDAVTFQEIARRAEVGRATLYRRWDSPAALVQDAVLQTVAEAVQAPDRGSLRADLSDILGQIGRFISGPVGNAAMIASLVIQSRTARDDAANRVWSERFEAVRPVFERAIARGEISADGDHEALFATIAGALYFRVIVIGEPINERWISRILDQAKIRERP